MNKFFICVFNLTAFAPILCTIGIIFLIEDMSVYIAYILFSLTILVTIMCHFILKTANKKLEVVKIKITNVKPADDGVVSFLLAYLMPLLTITASGINIWVLITISGIFLLIIFGMNAYHANPLLMLFRYHFYEASSEHNVTYIIITKKRLKKPESAEFFIKMTDYMVLDKE